MPTNPYTSASISGYNSSPPPDDGSTGADNTLKWSFHKDKLADPVKTLAEAVNTNVLAAFGKTINTDSAEDNAHAGGISYTPATFTIATGAITPTRVNVVLAAESGTADTLDTMATASMSDGGVVVLSVDTGDTITINDAEGSAGQIHLNNSIDLALSGNDFLAVIRDGADWYELYRSVALTNLPTTLTAEQATTSGSTITFSSIPTGVKWIDILFDGVSSDGTASYDVQLGDAGGLETSGYTSSSIAVDTSPATRTSTSGFAVASESAAIALSGIMHLRLQDSAGFTWVASHTLYSADTQAVIGGGTKSLTAELTQLALTTSDTLDAGAISIQYGR